MLERATYENADDAQWCFKRIFYANSSEATFLDSIICCRLFYGAAEEVSYLTIEIIKAKLVKISSGRKPISFQEAITEVKHIMLLDA